MDDDGWEVYTFYHGTLTGYRKVVNGRKYEIFPTNGRKNSWDVTENDEWVGETFGSVDDAKAWVDG